MAISFLEGVARGIFEMRQDGCKNGHSPYFRITTGVCIQCERDRSRRYQERKRGLLTKDEKVKISEYNKVYSREYTKRPDVAERRRAYERKKYNERKEYFAIKNKKYRTQNPEKVAFHAAKSRRGKKDATPHWLTCEHLLQMQNFYEHARDCAIVSGEKYHVDHIVPIKGKNVCGLHVPWNLQVLPWDVNVSKGNKMQKGEVSCV